MHRSGATLISSTLSFMIGTSVGSGISMEVYFLDGSLFPGEGSAD